MSAPRKYADAERTQVTPEWLAWRTEQEKLAAVSGPDIVASHGYPVEMFLPGPERLVPVEGAWILVLEEPHTVMKDKFRLPLLSLWRARYHELNSGGVVANGVSLRPKQAVITTPAGDLHLWPHEYIVVTDPLALFGDEDATLHYMGGENPLDEDAMFYLQSRGISHKEAVAMLFDTIDSIDFVYVTFPEEVTAQLEGVGQPLWRHIQNNPREKVAS